MNRPRPKPFPGGADVLITIAILGAFVYVFRGVEVESIGGLIPEAIPALGLVGLLAALFTSFGLYSAIRERARARKYPDRPWLWRQRWQGGTIGNNALAHLRGDALLAAIAVLVAAGFDNLLVQSLVSDRVDDLAAHAIVAIPLTALAAFLSMRFKQAFDVLLPWRRCRLRLHASPGRIGEKVSVSIETPAAAHDVRREVQVLAGLYRAEKTRHNWSMPLQGTPLWESSPQSVTLNPVPGQVTLAFDIPPGRPSSDWSSSRSHLQWQITVRVDERRSVQFDIPVFAR